MKKTYRYALWLLLAIFIFANAIAAIHAYRFTHFSAHGQRIEATNLSAVGKFRLLFTGVDNPRPVDTYKPWHPYSVINIKSNVNVECWYIPALKAAKGTVLIFHGYTASKSASLGRAEPLVQDGYNCLLVDFMGSGGSGGNSTTIGFKEAREVKDCYNYINALGEKNIFLYGSSMGAVSIMKAMNDYNLKVKGVVIDAPFATMYQTVAIRFRMMHVPVFPLARIMLFWGGIENGFWAFSHNPVDYAKHIKCPLLEEYGEMDDRVGKDEIEDIFNNLTGDKKLIIYPNAGHDNFVKIYNKLWSANMLTFLNGHL